MTLDEPLFPERNIYTVGETADRATKALIRWALGNTFHRYGTVKHGPSYSWGDTGQLVVFRSWINYYGSLSWSVTFRRHGEDSGLCSGYSCPEDAAYAACSLIEQHEREQYEQSLVVGLS